MKQNAEKISEKMMQKQTANCWKKWETDKPVLMKTLGGRKAKLIELIENRKIGCGGGGKGCTVVRFKTPSTCGSCVRTSEALRDLGFDPRSEDFIRFTGEDRCYEIVVSKIFGADTDAVEAKAAGLAKKMEEKRSSSLSTSAKFKELAEQERAQLRKRGQCGSSSDLFVNENTQVAVIGVQISSGSSGHDTIYVLNGPWNKPKLTMVLDRTFSSGRMFPTAISEDGKTFSYTVKDESGNFRSYKHDVK